MLTPAQALSLDKTQIIEGDALEVLGRIPDGSVRLCVTSPPYNIGKCYERGSFASFEQYEAWMTRVLELVFQKLVDGGSLCLQLGNHVAGGIATPLDYVFYPILRKIGFTLRNRIVWSFNFGLHANHRLSGRYEVLLWLTKGDGHKFNLDPIRVKQLYPGKRHSQSKGGKAGKPSGNPKGKNPSDVWTFDPRDAFHGQSVWDIPNVKANHPEKTTHPCQFPNELVERCVLAFSDEGEVVLDPFVGTGTSVISAHGRNRIAIGIELQAAYVVEAQKRLALLSDGKLPLRTSGKPPAKPKQTEKVATRPTEWAA